MPAQQQLLPLHILRLPSVSTLAPAVCVAPMSFWFGLPPNAYTFTWHLAIAFGCLPVSRPTLYALADFSKKLHCQPEAQKHMCSEIPVLQLPACFTGSHTTMTEHK